MAHARKILKKPQNIHAWIRERTSPYCFGVRTQKGKPAHVNKNDDIAYHFQCLKIGWYRRRLSRLKNEDMTDHFAGRKTYYFTADGRSMTAEVLVNLDIDCHNSGSLKGALAFAGHLKATKFPNLYFEVSTNGNGVHGYIIVVKDDLGDEGLNGALLVLDRWLKAELSKGNWDVENVEVKAHCPEFTWGREKYELKSYKSGQLAKLPREALIRADELRGTTQIAVDDLRRLKVSATGDESNDSFEGVKKKPAKKVTSVSVSGSDNWDEEASFKKQPSGSILGRHFDEAELSKVKSGYLSLSEELLAGEVLAASSRKAVKEEDLAIFLMLVKFFTANMNADGSLPTARWKEMWQALHASGDVGRAWCHHRFKALRNFLSDKDLIAWEQEEYVAGVFEDGGRFVPGKAAKWCAAEGLMTMLEGVDGQQATVIAQLRDNETDVEVNSVVPGCGVSEEAEDGEGEEEKSILYGYKGLPRKEPGEKEEEKSILCGYTTFRIPSFTPKTGQSTMFLRDLEHLGILMPLQRPRFIGVSTGRFRMAA